MFQLFKSHFTNPKYLSDEDLEPTYIDLKNKLLTTNYYEQKEKYNHLDTRLSDVLTCIFSRHERYILDIEATLADSSIRELFIERRGASWESPIYFPGTGLPLNEKAPELLFYYAMFAYIGGFVKNLGLVTTNPDYGLIVVDYLIEEHDYKNAIFLKGIMFKYGLKHDVAPKLHEAQILLKEAADKGVGGALIELRQFNLHLQNANYAQ